MRSERNRASNNDNRPGAWRWMPGMLGAMKLPMTVLMAGMMACMPGARAEKADASEFEKDRKAILSMAGDFEVSFHFEETVPLREGYAVKEQAYNEDAHETVKVVEDAGKRIVLQHILQVGDHVVKHWSQVWTYEDTDILEFQGDRIWETKHLEKAQVAGTWSQRVTEVTDEPRYEGYGKWIHHQGASEWTSSTSNRPLPRREYTKRNDYDLLIAVNRHTVTPGGWYHGQDNVKQVKRNGASYPLCRETGFNIYKRVTGHDFTAANDYWTKTAPFWKEVREAWDASLESKQNLRLKDASGATPLSKQINDLAAKAGKGEAVTKDEIRSVLKGFVEVPRS